MTQLFLAHTSADSSFAAQLGRELEASGYRVVVMPSGIPPESPRYARALDDGVLGSEALVLVWSAAAAGDEWAERAWLAAQRLRKSILVIALDSTALPPTLALAHVAPTLDALRPHLPLLDSESPLREIRELLAHEHIRERRKGIEKARDLLAPDSFSRGLAQAAQSAYREEALALLEHVARHDLIGAMRELAQQAMDAEAARRQPPIATIGGQPPAGPNELRYRIGVRCPKGHVSWFDARRLCHDHSTFAREVLRRAGAEVSEIQVTCGEGGCGETVKVRLNCEDYE